MRGFGPISVALLLSPAAAAAQQAVTVEIGTALGATILTNGGTLTHIGVPGAGVLGPLSLFSTAPVYATFVVARSVMIQPELSLSILTGEGSSATTLGFGTQLGYMFLGATRASPFVAATGALWVLGGDLGGTTQFGAGGRVGYRIPVGTGFSMSLEGGYRRWFGDLALSEVTIGIRFGGIVTGGK